MSYNTYCVDVPVPKLCNNNKYINQLHSCFRIPTFKAVLTIFSSVSPPPGWPIQHLRYFYPQHNITSYRKFETNPIPTDGILVPSLRVKYGIAAADILLIVRHADFVVDGWNQDENNPTAAGGETES